MREIKISFLGDIMFEQQYLKAAKLDNGMYNFISQFENIKPLLSHSDYIVGNLETVIAGEHQKYSHQIYSFNSPNEVLEAVKDAGISMVTTANNHCLDRGIEGLRKTIVELDQIGIEHTGTFLDAQTRDRFLIKELGGFRIAFLSYTYGTNYDENKLLLSAEEVGHINLLKNQQAGKMQLESKNPVNPFRKFLVKVLQSVVSSDNRMKIKKILGLTLNVPISDSISEYDLDPNYLNEITDQIERAKKSADFIFFCVHVGGQFNDKPGDYTKYIMNFAIEKGVDAIIGTHPHVVQKAELIKGKPVFYSLGNFSFSPSSIYVLHDLLPEYSIAPHFYFTNTDSGISLKKITYSVLKTIESDTHQVYVHDVYDLLNHSLENKDLLRIDLDFVNKRLMGSDNHLREYEGEFEIFSK